MYKIKKNDVVIVGSGSDKGRQGKVLRIFSKGGSALVENIRMLKEYTKPNPERGITGGIIAKESPIPLSKLRLYNPATQKADKVSIKVTENNKRARFFKSDGSQVDMS